MPKTFAVSEVDAILGSGRFEELLGGVEDGHLECKAAPYQLDQDRQKMELAKDVSALANADGGILLIGVQTERNPIHLGDEIRRIGDFASNLVDTSQYLKVLSEWIYPAIRGLTIQWHSIAGNNGSGIVCIRVPQDASRERPYLVGKVVEATGRVVGSYFGFFERVQSDVKPTSFEELRERLKDGFRFFDLDGRMREIEAALGTLVGAAIQRAGLISEQTVVERITQARQAVQLQERPTVYLAAWPSEPVEFPTLFDSRTAAVVQLLDNPPRLRHSGFDVNTDQPSAIVQGQLRRSINIRPKLLELWRDGVLISVAPGDEWYLCWGMNSNAASGLNINNLALAETTYAFCNLVLKIFEHAIPQLSKLNLCLGLMSMTTPGGPCSLSSRRISRIFPDRGNAAPGDHAKIRGEFERASSDAGTLSYGLLADLYAWFGFEADQMPYVNRDAAPPKIDAAQLISQTG
jgi:Schlafen, AlbA_2